jgi:hypothetical protein
MTNVATHSATALTRSRTMNPTAPERSGHRPGRSRNLAITGRYHRHGHFAHNAQ